MLWDMMKAQPQSLQYLPNGAEKGWNFATEPRNTWTIYSHSQCPHRLAILNLSKIPNWSSPATGPKRLFNWVILFMTIKNTTITQTKNYLGPALLPRWQAVPRLLSLNPSYMRLTKVIFRVCESLSLCIAHADIAATSFVTILFCYHHNFHCLQRFYLAYPFPTFLSVCWAWEEWENHRSFIVSDV